MPAQPPHEGEQQAGELRKRVGLRELEPITDIVMLIERLGIPVFLTALPGGIAGLASRVNGRWYIVCDTSTSSAGRLRFTLAHELGHTFMGHAPSIDDTSTLDMHDPESPLQEVAANYFAAELLLPRHAVEDRFWAADEVDDIDGQLAVLDELANHYGTTLWVPLYRLRTLDLITHGEVAALRRSLAGRQPSDHRQDVASAFAGTGQTRFPPDHDSREANLEDATKAQ